MSSLGQSSNSLHMINSSLSKEHVCGSTLIPFKIDSKSSSCSLLLVSLCLSLDGTVMVLLLLLPLLLFSVAVDMKVWLFVR